jgi:serine/threonine protein kinase
MLAVSGQVPRPGELPPLPSVRPPKDAVPGRPDPLIGTVIGDRYRLIERIGVGGMATVYRAEHQLLRKSVAVKLLLPELVGEGDLAARFEREAVAAARLDHPNVVSITDFGRTTDGQMFLVMEFLEGTPLDELIDRDWPEGRLPWERAVEITRQILRGLAHAHDVGVVHRDLKPSNIMVTSHTGGREVAKIIDFGIAKIVGGSPIGPHVETQAGIIFGTADFLAPERLLGRGDSDPRSDLYSVGVILYEMLAGERPFYDPDPYLVVKRAVAETPQAPSTYAPDCPSVLDAIVLRALAKEPEQRHGSAREMLAVLDPLARRGSSAAIAVPVPAAQPQSQPGPLGGADMSFSPMANVSTPPGGLSSRSPLPLFEPKPPKRARWIVPAIGIAAAFCVIVAIRGGAGGPAVAPVAATASASAGGSPDSAIEKLITKAAEGETVADRQSAFDRLVAFGYLDRVPWVAMLGKDLAQLPTCEERKAALEKLRKVNDSSAIPYIQEAAGRADNGCLEDDAQKAMAGLRATGTTPDSPSKKKAPSRSSGGGGHF